jgi:hypothetical protein
MNNKRARKMADKNKDRCPPGWLKKKCTERHKEQVLYALAEHKKDLYGVQGLRIDKALNVD